MEKRPYDSRDDVSAKADKYPRTDSYSRGSTSSSYSSRDNYGGYSAKSEGNGYSSGYSKSDDRSTQNSYSSRDGGGGGGYSSSRDNNSYSSNSYSRSDGDSYKSDRNSYSRNDSSSGGYRGGYNSRGRGGGRGGFGSQDQGDNWSCSGCKFSNFASRTSCYKCRNPKEGGGGGGYDSSRKWGSRDDSSWKKPSYGGDSKYGSSDRRDSSYSSYKKNDSWGSKGGDGLIDWDDINKNEGKYAAERWAHLPTLIKDLYVEDGAVASMTSDEVKQWRENSFQMTCSNNNKDLVVPNPCKTFMQAFSKYPLILAEIKKQGFSVPSAIQSQAWPILMKGFDMIGTSQTGSGKTLAFLLPALLHIVAQPTPRWERIGPTVLVLAPTRELAQQIEREVTKFQYENIRCVCCYGQGDKRNQIQKLNAMSEIVIATPGRLNDFVESGVVDLSGVSYLVLDEGDRMLDMGFEPQVRKIVMNIRPDRQTVLTSATWPTEVRSFAQKLMKDPIHVVVGSLDLQAVDTITQHVVVCSMMEKEDKLMGFLHSMKPEEKAIVFVAQKITVDHISVKLLEAGLAVESMHGGRNQRDREYSLRQLKSGRSKVLIATDVAARGIDIQDITHVLNYDCPKDMEEYVHRVGRTGRAGRTGQSLTLMCRDDWKVAGKLIEILEKSNQEIPSELVRMRERWDRVKYDRDQFGGGRNNSRFSSYGGRNGWTAS